MKSSLIALLLFKNIFSFSYNPNLNIEGGIDFKIYNNSYSLIDCYFNISVEAFINKMLLNEGFATIYVGPMFEINYFKNLQGNFGINWILINNGSLIKYIGSLRILIGIKYLRFKYLNIVKLFLIFKNDKKLMFGIKLDVSKIVHKKHHGFIRIGTYLNYEPNRCNRKSMFPGQVNNENLVEDYDYEGTNNDNFSGNSISSQKISSSLNVRSKNISHTVLIDVENLNNNLDEDVYSNFYSCDESPVKESAKDKIVNALKRIGNFSRRFWKEDDD